METQQLAESAGTPVSVTQPNSLASSVLQNIFGRNGLAHSGRETASPMSDDPRNAPEGSKLSEAIDSFEIPPSAVSISQSRVVRDVLSRLDSRKERAAAELGIGANEVESLP